jgi:hypothetical protein
MTWRFYTHGTDELAMTPASASPCRTKRQVAAINGPTVE